MADAYARLTGQPGVCLTTLGPGAANATVGLANAYLDRSPVLLITAQSNPDRIGHHTHQVIDLRSVLPLLAGSSLTDDIAIPEGHYADDNMKSTVVPFRNGILLSVAAGFAESVGAEGLVIAAHSGDHAIYPDCREEFLAPMAQAIAAGTYVDMQVLRPFVAIRKEDIAARGAALGVDFTHTWSCYKGGETHCGKCGTCVERKEAFALAKMEDPTPYLA